MEIKLLSLNMHCGFEDNYEEKLNIIADEIVNLDIDIIALQECSQTINASVILNKNGIDIKEDNLAYKLTNIIKAKYNIGYDYYWDFSHIGFDIYEEGSAILSKHNIIENDSKYITKSHDSNYWKSRKIVRGLIKLDKYIIDIYSVHAGWWDDIDEPFKYQFDNLVKYYQMNKNNYYTFLMGDFNNKAGSTAYKYITNYLYDLYSIYNPDGFFDKSFIEVNNNNEFENDNNGTRIDYIFSDKLNIDIKEIKFIFTENDTGMVSDHYGIYSHIKIK